MPGPCRNLDRPTLLTPVSCLGRIPFLPWLVAFGSAALLASEPITPQPYVPGHVLVKIRATEPAGMSPLRTADLVADFGASTGLASELVIDAPDDEGNAKMSAGHAVWILLRGANDLDVNSTIARLRLRSDVAAAEPDWIIPLASKGNAKAFAPRAAPNDPEYANQRGLAFIEASTAWNYSQGSPSQIIAVIDTGVDGTHADLSTKIWKNPVDKAGDVNNDGCPGLCGVDDDGDGLIDEDGAGVQKGAPAWDTTFKSDDDENGFKDDISGWNFAAGSADTHDDNGHGTFCAGIAAAATNNLIGIAGTCPLCRVMPLKAFASDGTAAASNIARAIDYARRNGATVISMSFASTVDAPILGDAIAAASASATLVAAAGNDRASRTTPLCQASGTIYPVQPSYPAAYSQVIGVEAGDASGHIATFSNCNYAVRAPGTSIESTTPASSYASWSGTSMAAPFISGIAGLLRAYHANDATWTAGLVYCQILQAGGNARLAMTLVPKPKLVLENATVVDDCASCDHDGVADASETVKLHVTLRNTWAIANAVAGTLTTSTAYATVGTANAAFGSIAPNATAAKDFTVTVAAATPDGTDLSFNLIASCTNCGTQTFPFPISIRSVSEATRQGLLTTETWTPSRVYVISGNADVPAGVTLTITPGTHVRFSPGTTLVVNGTLIARGTETQKIVLDGAGWSGITFQSGSTTATFDSSGNYLSGCAIEHARIEGATGSAAITAAATWIARNVITGNTTSFGIRTTLAGARIEQNLLTGNSFGSGGAGAALAALHTGTFIDNTIVGNGGDALLVGCFNVRNNSVFSNSGYELRVTYPSTNSPCNFGGNYFATADGASLSATEVFDFARDASLGSAIMTPLNTVASALAPPTVKSIVPNPPSPVGKGFVSFATTFSRPMAMDAAPSLFFGLSPPYIHPISIAGRWANGVDLVVVSPGGSAKLNFTFIGPPSIAAVAPTSGSTGGGTSVVITGTNLDNATSAKFGGFAGAITATSATSVTVTAPAHAAGTIDVVIDTFGGTATATAAFTYGSTP